MYEIFEQAVEYLGTTQGAIAVIVVAVTVLWQYHRFVIGWNFNNYHELIKELNQSGAPGEPIKLYRQVAVVYELRNYPRYYSVSRRILENWLGSRKAEPAKQFAPLYREMELSIEFMS